MKPQSNILTFQNSILLVIVAAVGFILIPPFVQALSTISWPVGGSAESATFDLPVEIASLPENLAMFDPSGGLHTPRPAATSAVAYAMWETGHSLCRIKIGLWNSSFSEGWHLVNKEFQGSCNAEKVLGQIDELLQDANLPAWAKDLLTRLAEQIVYIL